MTHSAENSADRPTPPSPGAGPPTLREPTPEQFTQVHESPEFAELRRSFRSFAFPMTAAFLIWYFSYVLLSTFAEGFMSTPVVGVLNIGLLMGLGQFASTFAITWLYVRRAHRKLDPVAERMRGELEGEI